VLNTCDDVTPDAMSKWHLWKFFYLNNEMCLEWVNLSHGGTHWWVFTVTRFTVINEINETIRRKNSLHCNLPLISREQKSRFCQTDVSPWHNVLMNTNIKDSKHHYIVKRSSNTASALRIMSSTFSDDISTSCTTYKQEVSFWLVNIITLSGTW
jgi:hypothetical protein